MPTIQVRTDDRTKTDSTALFQRLGITMSDAINLFLRQSVMRGGIPFPLTVTGMPEIGAEIFENEAFIDALKRYKSISGKEDFDIAKTEPFFRAVKTLNSDKSMRITLQENAVKVRLNNKGEDYILDYNFEEPDSVFILSRRDGKLFVKDCNLNEISETLELFK
jgi:DNA-damage-inducible protein J